MNKKWPLSLFTPPPINRWSDLAYLENKVLYSFPLKLWWCLSRKHKHRFDFFDGLNYFLPRAQEFSRFFFFFFCSLSRLLYELQQILVDKIFMLEVEVHLATFFHVRRCNLKWINVQLRCSISYLQCINFACYVIAFLFINKIQFHVPILKTSTTERCTLARLWMYHLGDGTSTTSQKYIFLMSVKLPIFMHLLFLPLISYA